MTATPLDPTVGVPPGVPENMIAPTGPVVAVGIPNTQDYPRLVYAAPYFTTVAIADVIEPSVMEAVENVLPSLIPPYVDAAVLAGIQQYSVLLSGSTMSGPLFLNPLMPTADAQAATKAYVDAMVATAGIPEVPPVPVGQIWGRETGQWVPIDLAGGTFLPISGGTMQGIINMSGNTITNMASVPAMPNGAAPAQWVLNQIASVSLYQGTWNADTNTPDLTQLSVRVNGYTWIAITTSVSGVVIGAAIPGLQGLTIYNGDTIIYSTVQGQFSSIHAGGLSLPEADARYVQLAGSQMSGALLLNADASQPTQAVTLEQLEGAVANTVTPDAPADGQAYLRVGVGAPANRWVPGMPLAGGIFTGAVTLAGPGASGNNPVTVTQLNSAISAAQAGFMPISGGTFTGPVLLSGNATVNLNPVSLGQLNTMLGTYAPIQNPAFSGVPTVPNVTPPTSNTGQIANTAFVQSAISAALPGALAGYLPLGGGTLSGQLNGTIGNFSGEVACNNLLVAGGGQVTYGAGVIYITASGTISLNAPNTGANGISCANINASSGASLATANVGGVSFGGDGGFATGGAQTNFNGPVFHSAGGIQLANGNNITPAGDNINWCGIPGAAWYGVAAYQFAQQSDARLKRGIVPSPPGALAAVEAIPVHEFYFEADATNHPHTGFDAAEVQAHHPNAYLEGEDENHTGNILLADMLGLLWQAVQELSAKVGAPT